MIKALCGVAAVGLALGLAGAAFGQETVRWYGIDCSHSRIAAPPGLTCRTTQNYAGGQHGWGGDAGGTFRQWVAAGHVQGAGVFYYLNEATSLGAALLAGGSLQSAIRAEMHDGNMVHDFSPMGHRGGADYMTFTSAQGQSCVGVRRYGPSQGGGYQWILHAVRCERRGTPMTEAEIDSFIASARYRGPGPTG
jgi:hypothetical protein